MFDLDELDEECEKRAADGEEVDGWHPEVSPLAPGSILPPIPRSQAVPARDNLPERALTAANLIPEDMTLRKPRLYILCFHGAGDSVLQDWMQVQASAPEDVEVATHEWPGHEVRKDEAFMNKLDDLGDDAFRAFKAAMSTGPFMLVGHSIGALVMTYVAKRAKQELGVHPLSAFVLDRGPPNLGIFTYYGYDTLVNDFDTWAATYSPMVGHALKVGGENGQRIAKMHQNDMQLQESKPPLGYYRFPCNITVLVAQKMWTDAGPPEYQEQKKKFCRCGWPCDFAPHEFAGWRDWAVDPRNVKVIEFDESHSGLKRNQECLGLLWKEARRLISEFPSL